MITLGLAAFGGSPPAYQSAPASAVRLLPAGPPKPQVIALQGTLRLQLPINAHSVTAIGYQAYGTDALPLQPFGQQRNEGVFSRVYHGLFGGGGSGIGWFQLDGGSGVSTGAVDIGAAAGTDVYSPVDGAVVSIQRYVLNDKQFGSELQIQPQGAPTVVLVVTHLKVDPALTIGSPVQTGSSRIGSVVDFSSVERQALATHTQDAGNHVTLAVMPAASSGLR